MALDREPGQDGPPIHELLAQRWSPRVYDPGHELTDEDLRTVLEAARWAPSFGNVQPWAFVALRRGDAQHAAFTELLSRGNASWVPRASAVVVTAHRVTEDDGATVDYAAYAAHDLGQATAHLSVQATALDLHVHPFAGFDHAGAAALLEVPAAWELTIGVAIGRLAPPESVEASDPRLAERDRRPRARNPLAEIAFADRFGTPLR
ncbi:nitroreductase [Conexibacter sp. W3-3-2]|uniref:nitroreductase family protein n=1 Tax=Conexibacter sp. W3-3-2 TaxID=2675227 RepID=UPI0012B90D30|nr:nitroreductase family protein [Conexibacter sp. W3-3-2]MTD45242.1 nitroreductase [Conexibacter sp. W3-3-2]